MTERLTNLGRFFVVAFLLAGAAVFLHNCRTQEIIPQSQPVSSFPSQLDGRAGRDVTIGDDVLNLLGPGDFLYRFYTRPGEPSIDFFLGYFPSQRAGNTPHSPKNCLPGSGWEPVASSRISFVAAEGQKVVANRYIVQKGLDRELVVYWYQSHGRMIASEYWERFYLIADAIRMNRTDGAIVRVVTPIADDETEVSAENRVLSFAKSAVPKLRGIVPL